MRKFTVYRKLGGGFLWVFFLFLLSFDKHSTSHFAVGRFLFSTNIYVFTIIFLWKKWRHFNWPTVGWASHSFPMKS